MFIANAIANGLLSRWGTNYVGNVIKLAINCAVRRYLCELRYCGWHHASVNVVNSVVKLRTRPTIFIYVPNLLSIRVTVSPCVLSAFA